MFKEYLMTISAKKGIVMILVVSIMAIFLLTITTIVGLSCGEAIQASIKNDSIRAYYIAVAGAERMYARLRDVQARTAAVL
jgi:hypothetical protein